MAEGGRGEGSRRHEATCLPAHRCVDVALSKAVFLSDHPAVQLQLRPPLHWNVETCRHQRSAVHFLDWSSGSYSSLSTMITVGGDCNQPPPPPRWHEWGSGFVAVGVLLHLRVLSLFQAWQESGSKPKLCSDMSERRPAGLQECVCCSAGPTDPQTQGELQHTC